MIDYKDYDLFIKDSVAKNLRLTGSGITITNSNFDGENFSIDEVLNSGRDLVFGQCNAAKLSFSVGYYERSMVGVLLTATTTPAEGRAFQFGKYKVASDAPTADRKWRDVVAYDKLYDVLKFDVAPWYNSLLANGATVTFKQFRDSFFSIFNITQDTVTLPQDNLVIKKTIDPKVLTGKSVLNAMCEINGCFGKIGRNGNFQYVFLPIPNTGLFPASTLYPADNLYPEHYGMNPVIPTLSGLYPANNIYPGDNVYPERQAEMVESTYISLKYEDYLTQVINKLRFFDAQGNVSVEVGSGDNVYDVKNNFLLFERETSELTAIANTMFAQISGIWYRPCEIQMVGNPCTETGDGIQLFTIDGKQIDTYVLHRKLKGIQSLKDTLYADGLEYRENDKNSINDQIVQIKDNIRKVEADVIETNLLIATEIQADRARISQLEADMITANQLIATKASIQELQAVDAKIDNLTAIAITTQNLSSQTISASQITTGTLDASRITVNNLSANSINSGTMSVERISDVYGGSAQSRWYEITYVSSGSLTDWVSVRNGANTGTVQVPTGLSLNSHRLYVLKGSPLDP